MSVLLNVYDSAILRKSLFLKIKTDIRRTLKEYPLVEMQTDVRSRNLRLCMRFRKFFINPPGIDQIHPP